MQEQAERHGLQLRDYLVLTALRSLKEPTQQTIGHALGLDKTTLTLLIDRLEAAGLVTRRVDPRDRRAHIPEATEAGLALQADVARSVARVEAEMLGGIKPADQFSLRSMLCDLINEGQNGDTQISGSCI
jgi:DNA-binding MarR family transcriptional regulator